MRAAFKRLLDAIEAREEPPAEVRAAARFDIEAAALLEEGSTIPLRYSGGASWDRVYRGWSTNQVDRKGHDPWARNFVFRVKGTRYPFVEIPRPDGTRDIWVVAPAGWRDLPLRSTVGSRGGPRAPKAAVRRRAARAVDRPPAAPAGGPAPVRESPVQRLSESAGPADEVSGVEVRVVRQRMTVEIDLTDSQAAALARLAARRGLSMDEPSERPSSA